MNKEEKQIISVEEVASDDVMSNLAQDLKAKKEAEEQKRQEELREKREKRRKWIVRIGIIVIIIIIILLLLRSCGNGGPGGSSIDNLPTIDEETGHEHEYEGIKVDPTCESAGYTICECKDCDERYVIDVVKSLGHDYKQDSEEKTKFECERCGDSYIDDSVKVEETEKEETKKEETKKEDKKDTTTKTENKTDNKDKTDTGNKNDKTETTDKKEPVKETEKHTHKYTETVKAATCDKDGLKTYTCSCGHSYTETIKKLGHSYVDTVVKPTTTSDGYTEHKCSRCGNSYKDNYTDKVHVHSYSTLQTAVNPGTTTDGYAICKCSCGDTHKVVIPSHQSFQKARHDDSGNVQFRDDKLFIVNYTLNVNTITLSGTSIKVPTPNYCPGDAIPHDHETVKRGSNTLHYCEWISQPFVDGKVRWATWNMRT